MIGSPLFGGHLSRVLDQGPLGHDRAEHGSLSSAASRIRVRDGPRVFVSRGCDVRSTGYVEVLRSFPLLSSCSSSSTGCTLVPDRD